MKSLQDMVGEIDEIELRSGDETTTVASVTSDSRAVEPGGLFVALSGHRFDGHDFIDAAVENGAAAVLVDRDYRGSLDVAVLETENTRRVLGPLGRWSYNNPGRELKVIGITGTNGKTSSSYLLGSIFRAAGWKAGIVGTIEYRWPGRRIAAKNTTPDGLVLQKTLRAMADDGVEVAIIEVSSHGLENGRVRALEFDAAIFTNLSHDHVDFHGSVEAYRRAKWRLFDEYLPQSADGGADLPVAVINIDDNEGRKLLAALANRSDMEVVSYGLDDFHSQKGSDHYQGKNLRLGLDGVSLEIREPGGARYELRVSLPGRFNAENMLGAATCARKLGVASEDISRGLEAAEGIPGRMERVDGDDGRGPAVFVDYAHSPDALQKVLETLGGVAEGRLWVVFGCGGDRDRGKRGPMGEVAARLADRIVVTSDNPRSEDPAAIMEAVVEGIEEILRENEKYSAKKWWRLSERKEAIDEAILRARPEDVILIAGKGHETTQERDGEFTEFDDRVVASQALRRRGEG